MPNTAFLVYLTEQIMETQKELTSLTKGDTSSESYHQLNTKLQTLNQVLFQVTKGLIRERTS